MKQFSLFLFLAFIVFACGGGESDSSSTNSSSSAANEQQAAVDVEKIWKQRCTVCHGLYGNMGTNGAANLQEVDISYEERVKVITHGSEKNPTMTAFGEILSEEEIDALARHTMSFNENL